VDINGSKMKNRNLNFIDLFAGCGGLSLGLELTGFNPLFVNELNPDAMKTYLGNRRLHNPLLESKYHIHDVKNLVKNKGKIIEDLINGFRLDYGINAKLGEIDLLVGGPPCQGFSGIGHRRSYSVDKEQLPSNFLYQDMAFMIHKIKPKIFLFENVRGLLNSKWTKDGVKGEIWEDVKKTFEQIPNYTIQHKLVFAKDYGVPQNRPRILLVGIRKDLKIKPNNELTAGGFLPEPVVGSYPDLIDLLGDLIDLNYTNGGSTEKYPNSVSSEIQKWLRTNQENNKVFPKGHLVSEQEYSNHNPQVLNKFKYMLKHNGKISEEMKTKKFAQRLLLERWDKDGPNITATSLADDYVHFSQPRVLTVREWARLQTFPDWYKFEGKRTTGGIRRAGNPIDGVFDREVPKYTQIGNAVPVLLAKSIGDHFKKILD
jgi:DNA (cytosine-5)-methyltransferase 1